MEANAYLLEDYVQGLFSNLKQKMTSEDMERMVAAYMLAKEAHQGQMRKSGEPYIIHPIAVARIVAEEFELGANPIMAAFLHDVVEDTPYTLDDIKERFGEDVAFLVGVVTKQKKSEYNQSKQIVIAFSFLYLWSIFWLVPSIELQTVLTFLWVAANLIPMYECLKTIRGLLSDPITGCRQISFRYSDSPDYEGTYYDIKVKIF